MNSSNNVRIKTIELSTLANLTSVFIALQQAPRKRTFWMRALLTVLALYPATAALAAAECNRPIAELYESKSPAVVLITALTINPYRMDDRIQLTTGSGFIIDTQGLVMTNSHVVFGAQALTVTLDDGTALPAKLLGADPIFDLAILQIPKPDNGTLPTLAFADSDACGQATMSSPSVTPWASIRPLPAESLAASIASSQSGRACSHGR